MFAIWSSSAALLSSSKLPSQEANVSGKPPTSIVDAKQRQRALAGWEVGSGAGPCGPLDLVTRFDAHKSLPDMGKAELLTLHIRVVALENMVLALLAGASKRQIKAARAMPAFIAPRRGATAHPLTILAVGHMTDLLARAHRFEAEIP
jgi:hypothetical protein